MLACEVESAETEGQGQLTDTKVAGRNVNVKIAIVLMAALSRCENSLFLMVILLSACAIVLYA